MRIDHHKVHSVDLRIGDKGVLSFNGIAALAGNKSGNLIILILRVCLVDIHEHEVRHAKTVGKVKHRHGGMDLGLQNIHEGLILHAVEVQRHHVPAGGVVIIIVKAGRVHKVRIMHAEFRRFFIHELDKGFFITCDVECKGTRTVCAGGKQITVDVVQRRRFITRQKTSPVRVCGNETVEHFLCELNRHILRIRDLLNRNNGCHHLGKTGRIHLFFRTPVNQCLSGIRIDQVYVITQKIQFFHGFISRWILLFYRFRRTGTARHKGADQYRGEKCFKNFHQKKLYMI